MGYYPEESTIASMAKDMRKLGRWWRNQAFGPKITLEEATMQLAKKDPWYPRYSRRLFHPSGQLKNTFAYFFPGAGAGLAAAGLYIAYDQFFVDHSHDHH
jgi:hypothetical protein